MRALSPRLRLALASIVPFAAAAAVTGCGNGTGSRPENLQGRAGAPSVAAPVAPRTVDLLAPLIPNGQSATGDLNVHSARLALVTTTGSFGTPGTANERVLVFDPTSASGPAGVRVLRTNDPVTVGVRPDSTGANVGPQITPTFTASTAVAGGKLFVSTSNLRPDGNNDPGTVLVFDIDETTGAVTAAARAVIVTSDFNPTNLAVATTEQGAQVVICVNTGRFGGSGSVDVINPATERIIVNVPLGAGNPIGEPAITSGRRCFLGSQSASSVFEVNLSSLDFDLANAAVSVEAARATHAEPNPIAIPSAAQFNFVADLALSEDERTLFVVNFNDSTVTLVDVAGAATVVRQLSEFRRTGSPAAFENLANFVDVRAGAPGAAFAGPDAFVLTINVRAADRAAQDVTVALDSLDSLAGTVALNASVAFTPDSPQTNGSVSDLELPRHAGMEDRAYVQEINGRLRILDLDALP